MKALALTKAGDPFEIIDVEEPEIRKDDQVKIKIHGTGVCGGDLSDYLNPPVLKKESIILGHEYSGEIVAVGSKVNNLNVGDRVIAESSAGCEKCIYCRDGYTNLCLDRKGISGSYTDYIVVPARYVYKLPEQISLDLATLSEPLACVINALEKTKIRPGDLVVVIGPGPLGIFTSYLARLKGARVFLVGRSSSKKRLEIAKDKLNLNIINSDKINVKKYISDLSKYGAETVFGCAGSEQVVNLAFDLVKKGGSYIELGLFNASSQNINFEKIVTKEIKVTGAVSHRPDSWDRLLKLYQSGVLKDLEKIITNKYPIKDWKTAFENLKAREDLKAVLY
ncbi:L-iditol 2-dehydrogenase [Halanaerobium saccharolyticum]|uniref:L-iditol 2-dehydrogenase n=1 Tax=Halanaerobium saccharolyticum TaxID=43595 RepID=A0A4R7Z712_9FIRM|nr:alcohol dehydrogenase catalytic domain-containing protein [Halanaerobium saccharolyticum]RAK12510.1 L-iditol 2-dehydrogenase [Halanaerobium saccharolyticum]TDW06436.1 L-iditol 2-dehydrogenase [Halanaerobium saccharolyticum]TDX61684.1 L-iditol 2-dehydrogenase [Halanaerobium saccharolyticum]